MGKKGVSPVVATVLIITVTVVTIGIIAPTVIKFTNENLDKSKECFDIMEDIKLEDLGYTCTNIEVSPTLPLTAFSVRIENAAITGFKVGLIASGSSTVIDVSEGGSNSDMKMYGIEFVMNSPLSVPGVGEVKTYVVYGVYDRVEVFPILESGRTCDDGDSIKIATSCTGGGIQ